MESILGQRWGTPNGIGLPTEWVIDSTDPGSLRVGATSSRLNNLQVGGTMTIALTVQAPSIKGISEWSITGYDTRGFPSAIKHQFVYVNSVFAIPKLPLIDQSLKSLFL